MTAQRVMHLYRNSAGHGDSDGEHFQISIDEPLEALLRLLGREAATLGFSAYVVGGFVRDRLATQLLPGTFENIDGLDIDIVLEGSGIQLARAIQARYGGHILTHERFGTATWTLADLSSTSTSKPITWDLLLADLGLDSEHGLPGYMDFVTARRESYPEPASLPEVQPSTMNDDLIRRDLSINTLAVSIHPNSWGQLLDFHNGVADLRNGVVRILHDQSFVDDPTRIFRTVRYEQRFGFTAELRTLELLQNGLPLIDKLTPVRLLHEFDRIFDEKSPAQVLARLEILGALAAVHPELGFSALTRRRLERYRRATKSMPLQSIPIAEDGPTLEIFANDRANLWALLLLDLPSHSLDVIFERLSLSKEIQNRASQLRWLTQKLSKLAQPTLLPSQVVNILDTVQSETVSLTTALCAEAPPTGASFIAPNVGTKDIGELDVGEQDVGEKYVSGLDTASPVLIRNLGRYLSDWQYVTAELTGNDLAAMGIPPGPQYREILATLRRKRLDGEIIARDEEAAYVQTYLH